MNGLLQIGISNALVAAIPALLAVMAKRFWPKPALVHSLWLLAFLKLVTPPIFHVPVAILSPSNEIQVPVAAAQSLSASDGFERDNVVGAAAQQPGISGSTLRVNVPWALLLCGLWAGGSIVYLATAMVRVRRFQKLLRFAQPAPDGIAMQVKRVACRLKLAKHPSVWLVPGNLSPMLWAFGGSAKLLLPEELWENLDNSRRVSLLAHELAHWRRKDHWVRYLELIASALYWWHPVVWWGRNELRDAEEQCCDAWVVWAWPSGRRTYATALLDTVDFVSQAMIPVPTLASGAVESGKLKERLTMIMKSTPARSLSGLGRAAVLVLGLTLLPAMPQLAVAEPEGGAPKGEAPREGQREPSPGDQEGKKEGEGAASKPAQGGEGRRREGQRRRGEGEGQPPREGQGEGQKREGQPKGEGERIAADNVDEQGAQADRPRRTGPPRDFAKKAQGDNIARPPRPADAPVDADDEPGPPRKAGPDNGPGPKGDGPRGPHRMAPEGGPGPEGDGPRGPRKMAPDGGPGPDGDGPRPRRDGPPPHPRGDGDVRPDRGDGDGPPDGGPPPHPRGDRPDGQGPEGRRRPPRPDGEQGNKVGAPDGGQPGNDDGPPRGRRPDGDQQGPPPGGPDGRGPEARGNFGPDNFDGPPPPPFDGGRNDGPGGGFRRGPERPLPPGPGMRPPPPGGRRF